MFNKNEKKQLVSKIKNLTKFFTAVWVFFTTAEFEKIACCTDKNLNLEKIAWNFYRFFFIAKFQITKIYRVKGP